MAIIGTIRKHSALAVILVGVAITAFVLSDLLGGKGRAARRNIPSIGVIAGEEISAAEYNRRVEENLEIQRTNQNKETLTQEETFNVRVSTWNQFVNEIIMGKEYKALDLSVTTDELYDLVQGTNPHPLIRQYFQDPNTGQYNPQIVVNFLQNLNSMSADVKQQWLNLERYIKDDRLSQKYTNLVTKAYYVPEAFARMDFQNKKKTAESRYVPVRYTLIPDTTITLTDKDFENYYEENKYQYDQDASRDIDYVVFEVLASAEDREAIREDVMKIYDDFRDATDIPAFVNATSDIRYDSTWFKQGELPVQMDSILFNSPVGTFVPPYEENNAWHMAKLMDVAMRPDSMKAEHILIAYQGAYRADQNLTRTKEQAEQLADSLLQVVKANKSKLQSLADQYSDDGSAKDNHGDLGWFADGSMVYPFNEAVINGNVGDVVVAETIFGYHVIRITGKKDMLKKVRAAIIDRAVEPSSKTYQDVYTQASIFAGENNTREKFDNTIQEEGLNKRSATYMREMGNNIAGINYPREVIRWAFTDGIKIGEVSPVFDVGDAFVVATLTAIREKGQIPLEQIRDNIRPFVMNHKKSEEIKSRIESIGNDIYQIASAYNTKVDTNLTLTFSSRNIPGFGSEPKVIGTMFTLEESQQSHAIEGNGAVFVVRIDKFYEPKQDNLEAYKQQMISTFRSRVTSNTIFTALESKAKIRDNRLQFF